MSESFDEKYWDTILARIKLGKCTPFLGAGASYGALPLGGDIAREWAKAYDYPMEDSSDLARVAQFMAVKYDDAMRPKEEILARLFTKVTPPDFKNPEEPHGVLADLPLPVYITTNYDDFMVQALKSRNKDPKQAMCRWNKFVKDQPSIFESAAGYAPTPANPLVFHLHGYNPVAESIVLTEDDYLDFLVNVSQDPQLLPMRIQEAITGTSLMFVGYRLADWDFRVLFRGLVASTDASLRRISITVQLEPNDLPQGMSYTGKKYLEDYFDDLHMRVYWGTAKQFAAELSQRWSQYQK